MTELQPYEPGMSDADLLRFGQQLRELTGQRQQMNRALRSVMTPLLRKAGFVGTCPRYRRILPTRYDLLLIQFDKFDPNFLIEIGQCTPDWYRKEWSAVQPVAKLTPWSLPLHMRARVQPRPGPEKTDCFQYGDAKSSDDFKHIAQSTVPFMQRAIAMFDDFEHTKKMGPAVKAG